MTDWEMYEQTFHFPILQYIYLINQSHIVNPESISHAADIGSSMTGIKLQDQMGWSFISISPSFLHDLHHFPLTITGIFDIVTSCQPHIRLIK